jgi:hypothetical protein
VGGRDHDRVVRGCRRDPRQFRPFSSRPANSAGCPATDRAAFS